MPVSNATWFKVQTLLTQVYSTKRMMQQGGDPKANYMAAKKDLLVISKTAQGLSSSAEPSEQLLGNQVQALVDQSQKVNNTKIELHDGAAVGIAIPPLGLLLGIVSIATLGQDGLTTSVKDFKKDNLAIESNLTKMEDAAEAVLAQ